MPNNGGVYKVKELVNTSFMLENFPKNCPVMILTAR
jgi:hypothetical protein